MQVDRLRLVGFKSFVEATEIEIGPGLTGIVGPNGCGKSNLAEAMRWAMGENSARRLRGGEMDDLIFAGVSGRPARDIAEAVLTLDNRARTAPRIFNDRDEIIIVRRVERRGGSVFRINGREARARDVQVLLADAAAGGHFGSVIGQGQVGALIEAKPAERRELLEEAAGTAGHRLRRREALGRLAAAEANLVRLDDTVAELRVRLDTATRQARRAKRYRRLAEDIGRCEGLLFRARRHEAEAEAARAKAAFEAIEGTVAAHADAAAIARRRRDAGEAALPALRIGGMSATAELARLNEQRAGLERELQRVATARGAAERRQKELAVDCNREEALVADAQAVLGRLRAERDHLAAATSSGREPEDAAALRLAAAGDQLATAETQLQRASATAADASARRAAGERRRRELGELRLRLERQQAVAVAQRTALAREIAPPEKAQVAAAAVTTGERRVAYLAAAVEAAERAAALCQSREADAFESYQRAATRHTRLTAEAETLDAVPLAQAAVAATPILAGLRVANGFEAAIGALFDDELAAPLGADSGAGCFWIDLPAAADVAALPDGACPLSAAIAAPAALGRRLGQSGWVEDAETGARLQALLQPGQSLVDRTGRLWRWDGFTRVEPSPSAAAKQLERRRRLASLSAAIAGSAPALAAAEVALGAARAERQQASEILRRAQRDRRQAQTTLDAARAMETSLARRALGAETRLAALDETVTRLAGELTETAAAAAANEGDLSAVPTAAVLEQALAEALAAATGARRCEAEARASVERSTQAVKARRDRLAALDLEVRSWRQRAESAARQREGLGDRLAAVELEIAALAERPVALAAESEMLGADIAAAAAAARNATDRLVRGEAELREAAEGSEVADRALAVVREERARLEAVLAAAGDRLRRLDHDISERFGSAGLAAMFADAAGEETSADPAELAQRIERLGRERDSIGPVNLVAESEAGEIGARIETLTQERAELTLAIGKLRRGIAALDREARARLLEAFECVSRHFTRLFVRLFGGGQAALRMTEDGDTRGAGLEILASPGGKRLQNLSLLSGGEQALTALALIFAVFLTNPAPVCVLDEVDASLDDANVERLCRLVADIAETTGTRFLLVTHHRITMARADRLYGVTMAEPGVSRLVSVELSGAQRLRQTA